MSEQTTPDQAHDGASSIEPERLTVRERCLRRLLAARGAKIPTSDFATISKSAERRVRELRDPAHGNWNVQCERVAETRTFVYWIDPAEHKNPSRAPRPGLGFGDWLEQGVRKGWVAEPTCATHQGTPTTEEEDAAWEAGDDPCEVVMRVWVT